MSFSIYPEFPPNLTDDQREYLISNLKDWSSSHGLAVRLPPSFISHDLDPVGVLSTVAPVTLFPSPFPKKCFEEACEIQTAYNELYATVAQDEQWLENVAKELIQIDDFIKNLWSIHQTVKTEGYAQDLSLGLFRSDYMIHNDPSKANAAPELRQVEFNTIASSFGGLAAEVSKLHHFLATIDAYPTQRFSIIEARHLPKNNSVASLASGLAAAHNAYGRSRTSNPLCVIFLVQDPERNVFDQRHLEYALLANHSIRSFRLPFDHVLRDTSLNGERVLLYRPPHATTRLYEVTTVYFRAGYSPDEYKSDLHWKGRLHLQRSAAINCPSILLQMAGTKKVQQILATPGSSDLSRFLPDASKAERVRKTFAAIYPMDTSPSGQEARALATHPDTAIRYVLKPQREGGGNNVYRSAIPSFLAHLPEAHWPAWILMEMIEPPTLRNVILRNGELQRGGVIGELGVFGVCLWRNPGSLPHQTPNGQASTSGEILENWQDGYLLRTKGDQSDEGGVAAGFGAVDSCCLIDI